MLLEPLIGGADIGETLRGPDLHLVNLLEGQDRFHEVVERAARHHVDVMDARAGRGMHPAARVTHIRTLEKPELLTKELDHEEHRNSATQTVPDERGKSYNFWAICSNTMVAVWKMPS